MKNILVIAGHSYRYLGGIESYHYTLFSHIKNVNFFEFPLTWPNTKFVNLQNKKVKIYDDLIQYQDFIIENISIPKWIYNSKNNFIQKVFKYTINKKNNCKIISKKLEQIIEENKINKILLSTTWYYDKKFLLRHKDKIYFIQHSNPFLYFPNYHFSYKKNKFVKFNLLTITALKILNIYHNPLKYVNNIIAYDEENIKIIQSHYKKKKFFAINLPSHFKIEKKNNRNNIEYNFISPIRLEKVKNVSQLVDFAKLNTNLKFVVCGDGSEKYKLNNIKNITHLGTLNKNELLKVYKKSRFLILFSFFEGFSFAITEALSLGIPCIVANTFPSAKYLIGNNNERGFLFDINDKNYNMKIINYINQIDYKKTSNNCLEFAKERLSIDIFNNKWNKIFENTKK